MSDVYFYLFWCGCALPSIIKYIHKSIKSGFINTSDILVSILYLLLGVFSLILFLGTTIFNLIENPKILWKKK